MAKKTSGHSGQPMQLHLASDPLAVRAALVTLLACPVMACLDAATRGNAEIVLAEVFNNIVEHAYATQTGTICVTLTAQPQGIAIVICDQGLPFPQGQLPQGRLPPVEMMQDIPEGGFGWFLIRNLVQDLRYKRQGDCNQLSFLLPDQTITAQIP